MSIDMDKSHVVSADSTHYNHRNRNFLRIILILFGVIILLAGIFFITIVYRKFKSGLLLMKKSNQGELFLGTQDGNLVTVFDSNFTSSK
jgi:hypothetical protein